MVMLLSHDIQGMRAKAFISEQDVMRSNDLFSQSFHVQALQTARDVGMISHACTG